MSDLDQIFDAEARGLVRLPEQFKQTEALRTLVDCLLVHFQFAEQVLWQLYTLRWLDTATGIDLDNLGAIIGEARGAHTDDEVYRLWIRARVLVNRSSGLPDELLQILQILDPVATIALDEYFPASYLVTALGMTSSPTEIDAILRQAKPAGVGTGLVYSTLDPTGLFRFAADDADETIDPMRGWGDDSEITGGQLADVVG